MAQLVIAYSIGQYERTATMKYRCVLCGYIYDPAAGDPDNGVAPGTAFSDLADDWVCPECGVGKADVVMCPL